MWLRTWTPELSRGSHLTSSSSTKSLKSPLHRKVLGLPSTVAPTIAPSSTLYAAVPPLTFHPSSVLPSKSDTQGPSAGQLTQGMMVTASVSTVVLRTFFIIGAFSCLVAGLASVDAPIFPSLAPDV